MPEDIGRTILKNWGDHLCMLKLRRCSLDVCKTFTRVVVVALEFIV